MLQTPRLRVIRWLALPLLACVAASAAVVAPVKTESQRASLDDVEAAYLYNFGKFVRWPEAAAGTPLVICIAGSDSFQEAVAHLVGDERIGGRDVQTRRVESRAAIPACSILFVDAEESDRLGTYLAAADGKPVLTVSDAPDFLDRGGIIQFVFDGDHVRFSVNLSAAGHNGLTLSSELLKVAVHVTGSQGRGGPR